MKIELKNIAMIKEASVNINGLTVIAGENDTGKSTLSKALLSIFTSITPFISFSKDKKFDIDINKRYKILFKEDFDNNQYISLTTDFGKYIAKKSIAFKELYDGDIKDSEITNISFIETPIVWNLEEMFNYMPQIETSLRMSREDMEIPYPFILKNLHFQLYTKLKEKTSLDIIKLKDSIKDIINGEFIKDKTDDKFYFHREDKKIHLINVATGIKYFGIIQVLLDNNRVYKNSILIFDEPEVHLHPKWQLEMAQIIVKLVKSGVKVLVNSHSPYMIEALKRYSDKENLDDKSNFYLAQDGVIENRDRLSDIFSILSQPFETFREMDREALKDE